MFVDEENQVKENEIETTELPEAEEAVDEAPAAEPEETPAPQPLVETPAEQETKKRPPGPLVLVGCIIALFVLLFACLQTGLFGGMTAGGNQSIVAQDGSFRLEIPADWLYYNEDLGDYFAATSPEDDYFLVIMRVNQADLGEEYAGDTYLDWLFSVSSEDLDSMGLSSMPVEEAYTLNDIPVREMRFSHSSEEGADYESMLITMDTGEYFYIFNFYFDTVNMESGLAYKDALLESFTPISEDQRPATVYGENDSLTMLSGETYTAEDNQGLSEITLYSDWQLVDASGSGLLLRAYNAFQNKIMDIYGEEKSVYAGYGATEEQPDFNTDGSDFDAYYDYWYEQLVLEGEASGRVIEEETDLTVNGMQAKRLIYSQQQYMESQTCAAYFIEGTDHYYQVYFFCAQSKFDRHLREFETILASFHEI